MRIAIIESDASFLNELENVITQQGWDVEFYGSSSDFSLADLTSMNVILADLTINGMSGQELLKSIHNKTKADLYLMSEDLERFCEKDAQSDFIKGLIRKDVNSIIAKLQYIESKIKIMSLTTSGTFNLNAMLAKANGYEMCIDSGIAYIELQTFLSDDNKEHMLNRIHEAGINKAIISYPGQQSLSALHYEQLLEICGFFQRHDKHIAFWNVENNACITEMLDGCKLNKIIPAFNDSEKAINYLNSK